MYFFPADYVYNDFDTNIGSIKAVLRGKRSENDRIANGLKAGSEEEGKQHCEANRERRQRRERD